MVSQNSSMVEPLSAQALEHELERIASWWLEFGIDLTHGGFHGEVSNAGQPRQGAPKSVILNTRILWFFSEAYRTTGNPQYHSAAQRAYRYIIERFVDPEHGGLFWEVDAQGGVAVDRKQTYAQAFGIFALSAYYRATGERQAVTTASGLFELLLRFAHDEDQGGYFEGFARDWQPLDDMRLSEVDHNLPKSMNNHLHVLEALAALLRVVRTASLAAAVEDLLYLFVDHFISPDRNLQLFFEADWTPVGKTISCGHDVEAAWLLHEAALILGNEALLDRIEPILLDMAHGCLSDRMTEANYLANEVHEDGTLDLSSPWWVQAEALVGYLWMYRFSREEPFLAAARGLWTFIQEQHIDDQLGEWLWDARDAPKSEHRDYKAGQWKGPYHNGRAMMEGARLMREIEHLQADGSTASNSKAAS